MIVMSLALLLSFAGNQYFSNNVLANSDSSITVNGEIVNLREGPGLTYEILKTVTKGETLTVLETSGDWYRVKSGRTEGWVASWLVEQSSSSTNTEQFIVSQVDNLNIRQQPSVSSAVLGQLYTGNEAKLLKQQGDWVQIQHGSTTGWVAQNYVTITSKNNITSTSTNSSKQTPYFTITVDAVNVRAEGSLNAQKIGVAYRGAKYKVLKSVNNWVQIAYENNTSAWIYSFYGSLNASTASSTATSSTKGTVGSVTVIYNGTNLRKEASTTSAVVERANAGQTLSIVERVDDFYKIQLTNGEYAYVANWVVSINGQVGQAAVSNTNTPSTKTTSNRKKGTLQGVSIVVDAGHGGNDQGTTGVRGTREKDITLLTAEKLTSKLRAAGATVYMTRESDTYVDLRKRVAISHQVAADAFISLHYDANVDSSVQGFTTYYANSYQKQLASFVNESMDQKLSIRNRGVHYGNYLVLRENRQKSILIELGFLSNASEERNITTDYFREQATLAIYQGLLNYFDDQLN